MIFKINGAAITNDITAPQTILKQVKDTEKPIDLLEAVFLRSIITLKKGGYCD